ncbi:MAG: alpha-L-rhamnosidase C-terminal domain-containing protein, partial [Limisphaerales bacterium]
CQYYENLLIASRVFSILKQANQSANYLRQAEAVKAAINAHLFNGQYYLARTDRQGMFPLASAWAFRFDIEPASDKAEILNAIERPGKPDIGGYGGDAFYSGLFNAGGGAFAVRDLARYRPMLESNKANWETWNTSGEVNHAWTSYPGYIFLKYICGIQPTGGGFATFDIRPDINGLAYAEGAVPTVKGLISTSWKKDDRGGLDLRVNVPANTRASIYIPQCDSGRFTVTESGRQIWPDTGTKDPGVLAISREDSRIKCVVGGGAYRFRETP